MTHFAFPTSITQGIVGALVGVGLIEGGLNWWIVGKLAIVRLITPLVTAVFAICHAPFAICHWPYAMRYTLFQSLIPISAVYILW